MACPIRVFSDADNSGEIDLTEIESMLMVQQLFAPFLAWFSALCPPTRGGVASY